MLCLRSPGLVALGTVASGPLCLVGHESLVRGEYGFSRDPSPNYWLCNFIESVPFIEPWFSHLPKRLVTLPSWVCVVTKCK